jgi:hypothetical protein
MRGQKKLNYFGLTCLDMKNIQGIFSNKIANLTFLPQPLRLPYVNESTYEIISV